MIRKITSPLIVALLIWESACINKQAPRLRKRVRPQNVPQTASLIEGLEYSVWVDCAIKNTTQRHYVCGVYSDYNGQLAINGEFIVGEIVTQENGKNKYQVGATTLPDLKYSVFNGESIVLEDGNVLIPDGVIIYSQEDGHGKKQAYRLGQKIGKEQFY